MERLLDFFLDYWPVILFIAIITALLVIVGMEEIEERKQWQNFALEHKCKKVGDIQPHTSVGTGVGMTGNGKTGVMVMNNYEPGKEGFLCDDGITYWRNK